MTSSVFHIPERSPQSFAVDFYKTSSLNFAFGLEVEILVQGDLDIITLIFTVNSYKVYIRIGYNKVLKGWNFIILTFIIVPLELIECVVLYFWVCFELSLKYKQDGPSNTTLKCCTTMRYTFRPIVIVIWHLCYKNLKK
jgi:hypothetical protein